ncbi:NAD-dependent succinate-semialdehyde dehydrogenase [Desulfomonile tiedjei]|uniref:Succinate-semialdehyde dehydrogenase n=1 Tax=Desulfomonile tiedjei (strain ATCC 49306 / DSM 6799 / DCB-1) TaxID=706587 RepID=I4C5H6_DESTA|nr:NAD-dependent succinate-semialdehyde dehydrogenase [Desulfomonile tiedjei]AFM24817.1 succinate-semialdehyde dehydrogenase [Desulfomonile tiedjei DSM 6799]
MNVSLKLSDKTLFRQQNYIDGKWVDADDGTGLVVTNPADGTTLGRVPNLGSTEVRRAVEAAYAAYPAWRDRTAKERALILRRWNELIMANQDDLAMILTSEMGKTFREAKDEVAYAAAFVEWFAEEGKRTYGDVIPSNRHDSRIIVIKQPVGVCAAITPWNFPIAMPARKAAPALAAGCTMVLKPASQTPYSALALAELAERAGIPKGVFNVVTGSSSIIGRELTENPLVRKLTFTGSTEVGRLLMRQCAGTVKKISLELGGHSPFIVFDDADLGSAVEGAIVSKYRAAGQTCVCTNRILVQDSVYDEFVNKFVAAASGLQVGNGLDPIVNVGPLIDEAAVEKMEEQIHDAVTLGATLTLGGKRHQLGRTFFEPTVLTEVTSQMLCAREETFGPIAPIIRFSSEKDAISIANDTAYGLAAYLYSRDLARVIRVSEALEYGIVGVNTGLISTEVAPFGGVKQSGIGREGSRYGIEDYLEIKYVCLGNIL